MEARAAAAEAVLSSERRVICMRLPSLSCRSGPAIADPELETRNFSTCLGRLTVLGAWFWKVVARYAIFFKGHREFSACVRSAQALQNTAHSDFLDA